MRYLWATVAAACLVGLSILNVRTLPIPPVPPGGGIELPSSDIWRIFLADLWIDYWFAIVPVIWIVCFAVAALLIPGSRAAPGLDSTETNKTVR
ncbi:MAG TPA: hypothetical protein VFG04_23300 [Planctomycetaceae bacterium]|jgi:hypothetical protein|nr:hypothetical protein [Planctomycetaceae bacterium]